MALNKNGKTFNPVETAWLRLFSGINNSFGSCLGKQLSSLTKRFAIYCGDKWLSTLYPYRHIKYTYMLREGNGNILN